MTAPEPEVMALETHVNETVERLRVRDGEVLTRSQVTVDWNRLRHLIGYNENRYNALAQQYAAAEAKVMAWKVESGGDWTVVFDAAKATQYEEDCTVSPLTVSDMAAIYDFMAKDRQNLTRERDAAQAQLLAWQLWGDAAASGHPDAPLASTDDEVRAVIGNRYGISLPTPTPQPEATKL